MLRILACDDIESPCCVRSGNARDDVMVRGSCAVSGRAAANGVVEDLGRLLVAETLQVPEHRLSILHVCLRDQEILPFSGVRVGGTQ
jgi:hypothetical protein